MALNQGHLATEPQLLNLMFLLYGVIIIVDHYCYYYGVIIIVILISQMLGEVHLSKATQQGCRPKKPSEPSPPHQVARWCR